MDVLVRQVIETSLVKAWRGRLCLFRREMRLVAEGLGKYAYGEYLAIQNHMLSWLEYDIHTSTRNE